jgi:predicted nucleotidyltransferase
MDNKERKNIVDNVAKSFEADCKEKLGERLEGFYLVGSYAFDKISLDRPDINFLLIFKERADADDFLVLADILRKIINEFKDEVLLRPDFRPFKSIYPKFRRDYEITINPIIMNMADKNLPAPFAYPKYFTEGIKNSRKLLLGNDVLNGVEIGKVTRQDIQEWMIRDILFQEIPLARAPVQYDEDEYDLFFNEVLTAAKNFVSWGIEIAMSDEELAEKMYVYYVENKEKLVEFYKERYGEDVSQMVEKVLDARKNYLKYKTDKEMVKGMFRIALGLAGVLKYKLFSGK